MRSSQLFDADFKNARLVGADLSHARTKGATFEGADVTDTVTEYAKDADLSGSTSKLAIGWVITFGVFGLIVVAVVFRAVQIELEAPSSRPAVSAAESRAAFETGRRRAEEEVTRLGEEIDLLDGKGEDGTDWHAVLDAYDAAKAALATAQDREDLKVVGDIVERGRDALTRPQKRA